MKKNRKIPKTTPCQRAMIGEDSKDYCDCKKCIKMRKN